MGLDLKPLVIREKTSLESFATRVVAIDAYNAIYQFLAIIRGPDGQKPLGLAGQGHEPPQRAATPERQFSVDRDKTGLYL